MNIKVLKEGGVKPLEELDEQEQKGIHDQMKTVAKVAALDVTEADEVRWGLQGKAEPKIEVDRDDLAALTDWAWDLQGVPEEVRTVLEKFNRLIIERDKNGKL